MRSRLLKGMLGMLAVFLFSSASQADTVLWFKSSTGDFIGQGQTRELRAPDWSFDQSDSGPVGAHFYVKDANGLPSLLGFTARPGESLQPAPYEAAARDSFAGASPGLSFSFNGAECNTIQGRFVVLEAVFGPDGKAQRLAIDFEQQCEIVGPPLYGEFRFNSDVPLTRGAGVQGTMPEPFALFARSPVAAGAAVRSNSFTVYGTGADVPVSIAGGQYSVNGGPFRSLPSFVQNLDHIVVMTQAPLAAGAWADATINVGGRTATLSATTYAPGMALNAMYYASPTGDAIGGGQTRSFLAPWDIIEATRNYNSGVSVAVTGLGGARMNLDLGSATHSELTTGVYAGATRFAFASGTPGLDFYGDGRGCNTVSGQFTVLEAVYGSDGSVQRFAADFEQSCEGVMPPLHGEVRINSTVPFSALTGPACAAGDSDGDGIPDCTEIGLGLNPNVKDNDVFRDPSLFAAQLYRDILGREDDAGGVAHWAGQIASMSLTPAQLVETFITSPEFQQNTGGVIRLYLAYFGRYPDTGGMQFWTSYRRGGHSLQEISDFFAGSAEFAQTYGSLTNAQFVTLVYNNVLGRSPDAGGFDFWRQQLDTGAMTRGMLMTGFSESAEFQGNTRSPVFATMLYAGLLKRAPDPGGFAYWVQQLDGGASTTAIIDGFIRSAEYRGRFLQ